MNLQNRSALFPYRDEEGEGSLLVEAAMASQKRYEHWKGLYRIKAFTSLVKDIKTI